MVLFVIVAGIQFIDTDNYKPFVPESAPGDTAGGWLHTPLIQSVFGAPGVYGIAGILFAASLVFFAYIGFDVVATTAEEARTRRRTCRAASSARSSSARSSTWPSRW